MSRYEVVDINMLIIIMKLTMQSKRCHTVLVSILKFVNEERCFAEWHTVCIETIPVMINDQCSLLIWLSGVTVVSTNVPYPRYRWNQSDVFSGCHGNQKATRQVISHRNKQFTKKVIMSCRFTVLYRLYPKMGKFRSWVTHVPVFSPAEPQSGYHDNHTA